MFIVECFPPSEFRVSSRRRLQGRQDDQDRFPFSAFESPLVTGFLITVGETFPCSAETSPISTGTILPPDGTSRRSAGTSSLLAGTLPGSVGTSRFPAGTSPPFADTSPLFAETSRCRFLIIRRRAEAFQSYAKTSFDQYILSQIHSGYYLTLMETFFVRIGEFARISPRRDISF
jgi:hypothetical protein